MLGEKMRWGPHVLLRLSAAAMRTTQSYPDSNADIHAHIAVLQLCQREAGRLASLLMQTNLERFGSFHDRGHGLTICGARQSKWGQDFKSSSESYAHLHVGCIGL